MEYKFLNKIENPQFVKELNNDQLNILCQEIRDCLINTVSKNGGHLASNLGTVELTVALHRVFNSPDDAIIFDVGHQCYTHKLLTGRYNQFSTLRTKGGISGFMRPDESQHDPFITGHSSNSISAAYGIYKAKALKGEKGTAVAVIGDGAMTGGMAYEALNNAGGSKSRFTVVLNDNRMSISKNVGAMAKYLNRIRAKKSYHRFKDNIEAFLKKIPVIGKPIRNKLFSSKTMLKNALYHSNIFEGLGFNYLGPVDGHNIAELENMFRISQMQTRPTLIHVVTVKGKGYSYAENQPNLYHGISAFNINEGAKLSTNDNYSLVAGRKLCEMASKDNKVCAVTAAMTAGTGLDNFSDSYKERFFDVGIAEEHAVTFCSGLAVGGMKPYFAVYSSFLQRGYDQIIHDAAIAKANLRLLIDRAGIVGEDGETHQGLFDVSFLSSVPGVKIYSPASYSELEGMLEDSLVNSGVVAIRYPRGSENSDVKFEFTGNDYDIFFDGKTKVAVSYGRISANVYKSAKTLSDVTFVKLNKIYPVSKNLIEKLLVFSEVYLFEEGIKSGGIAEKIASALIEKGFSGKLCIKAVDNSFVACASVEASLEKYGLDGKSITKTLGGN